LPPQLELNFTYSAQLDGKWVDLPLVKGGEEKVVTEENKGEYIRLYIEKRVFGDIGDQMIAFAKGFADMIPAKYSRILSVLELNTLVSGTVKLDLDDMMRHVVYTEGYHQRSPVIQWFWSMVKGMTPAERESLLLFWSGSPVPPLFGFASKVTDSDSWTVGLMPGNAMSLPSSSTCSFLLRIPNYPNEEVLRERFKMALRYGVVGYTER